MAKKQLEADNNPATREPIVAEEAQQAHQESIEAQQAVASEANFAHSAKENATTPPSYEDITMDQTQQPAPQKREKCSGGTAIALLALLVALGVGGAGYYFGTQELTKVSQQVQQVQTTASAQIAAEVPNFDAEKAQVARLTEDYQKALDRLSQLERDQSGYTQQINNLQRQIQQLDNAPKSDNSLWLLSDADFLLNNALRKLVLDNDITTTKNLLIEADSVLSQVTDAKVLMVREAIKSDLNQLAAVNEVDQNALMVRLTALANSVDDMPMLNNNTDDENAATNEVSDSIDDWQKNIEKSAGSFLDHFVRISDKNAVKEKEFIAPNQEIYLRENIRLRLQIAILAIPRQQNELYKQSLDAVSTWVRSYFDEQNDNVKSFLKELDSLSEQSIYVDAPKQLQSLTLLDQLLNKAPQKVEKVEIEAEKALDQATPAAQAQ